MVEFLLNPVPKPAKQIFEKTCLCGKTFKVKPCQFNNPNVKYCSNSCRYKYAKPKVRAVAKAFNCSYCGKHFERFLGQWNRFEKTYCSNECAQLAKRNRKTLTCLQCGEKYEKSMSKVKGGSKFCKRSCWIEWLKDHPRLGLISSIDNKGVKNGQYKHGKYAGRGRSGGDTSKLKVRKMVAERDGNWCLFCGKPAPGLHLHRVIYGSHGGKYEVDNCVQLCREHHEQVHSSKLKWAPILLDHLEKCKAEGIAYKKLLEVNHESTN